MQLEAFRAPSFSCVQAKKAKTLYNLSRDTQIFKSPKEIKKKSHPAFSACMPGSPGAGAGRKAVHIWSSGCCVIHLTNWFRARELYTEIFVW